MRRREFIAFLGSVAPSPVASPLAARAQQPSRASRASGFAQPMAPASTPGCHLNQFHCQRDK
jgi:hypothetical protein